MSVIPLRAAAAGMSHVIAGEERRQGEQQRLSFSPPQSVTHPPVYPWQIHASFAALVWRQEELFPTRRTARQGMKPVMYTFAISCNITAFFFCVLVCCDGTQCWAGASRESQCSPLPSPLPDSASLIMKILFVLVLCSWQCSRMVASRIPHQLQSRCQE
jgi:hypothetical protein